MKDAVTILNRNRVFHYHTWLRDEYGAAEQQQKGHGFAARRLYDVLAAKQERLREVSEKLERRISDDDLRACAYLTSAKVLLHAHVYAQWGLLVMAQITRREALKVEDPHLGNQVLETSMATYLATHVAASRRMVNALCEACRGFINQTKREQYVVRVAAGGGASGYMYREWSWQDTFESHHPHDPFTGSKIVDKARYTVSGKQDDIDRADEKACTGVEQYGTDHLKAVADLSHIRLQYPIFEAANVAQTIPEQYATALNARTRAHRQLARPPAG